MRSKIVVVVLAVILVAVAVFAFTPHHEDGGDGYVSAESMSEMFDRQISSMDDVLNDTGSSIEEMEDAIIQGMLMLYQVTDGYSWSNLYYHLDPKGYSEEYSDWSMLYQSSRSTFFTTVKNALNGDNTDNLTDALEGMGFEMGTFLHYGEMTEQERDLLSEINTMEQAYYVLRYDVTGNLDEIADLYVDLVSARNDLASMYGYSNYAEYVYVNEYSRDYLPKDIETLYGAVPMVLSTYNTIRTNLTTNPEYTVTNTWLHGMDIDDKLSMITPFLSEVSEDMVELLYFMEGEDLLYIDDVPGQLSGAYTSNLPSTGLAYIYIPWSNAIPASTLIHEFGHATNMCLNRASSSCYDVKEIHSQGLEALFSGGYSDTIQHGDVIREYCMYGLTSGVYNGILISAFENWAYTTEAERGLTREQLYDGFDQVMSELGLEYRGSGNSSVMWASIHHVFDSPCYYISYATSALSAMELFMMAEEDPDEACEAYLNLMFQEGVYGYVDAVEMAGLSNMMDQSNYMKVISYVWRWANGITA